jgi:hypothetical protein
VAASGDTVVIGAPNESSNATGVNPNQSDNSAANSGAAYVFVRDGTTWTQQAYLKASNTGLGDAFGHAVAVSCNTTLVGAYLEDSAAIGANGDGCNDSAVYAGAAYVFTGVGLGPRLSIIRDGTSGYFIRYNAIPGCSSQLQRAPNLLGSWGTVATSIAPASGLIEFHDAPPQPGQAFYRTVQP